MVDATTRSSAIKSARKASGWYVGQRRTGIWLGLAPAGFLLAAFAVVPTIQGVRLAFSEWGGVGEPEWIGMSNVTAVLSNGSLYESLLTTLKYASICAVTITLIGTVLAAVVSAGSWGASAYRVIWFLPAIAPLSAVAVFWAAAFQPATGIVNVVLGSLGLGSDHAWLADPSKAIYPIVIATVWASVGFAFLLMLGAAEQIPVSLYEAARVDGASTWKQFISVTIPLVRPTLAVTLVLQFIWAFNGFGLIWAMTQGGPGNATATLPVLVYIEAFKFTRFGPASAIALLGGLLLLIVGAIGLRLANSAQELER